MKGKKGLDYIDWSMSMGIFIIAIIALFVFLKPGARPEHDQDTLVNIVEQKFLQRTQWFVHETPIYVKKLRDLYGSGQQALVEVSANGDIRFTAVKSAPQTLRRYGQPIRTGTKITLNCDSDCDDTNFTIIGTTKTEQETIDMEAQCTPSSNPAACATLLGATVTHQGLRQSEITALRSEDYTTLKRTWTYPLQREFAIYQDNNKIIGGQEPGQQADVFVKERRTQVIDDQGVTTQTTINIRVW